MRLLLALCMCFYVASSSALAQQPAPNRALVPAPVLQTPTTPQAIPQTEAILQDPPDSSSFNQQETPAPNELDLDSNQSFDFDDAGNDQFASASDFESSIASNSNFRGASPQMIGDFGGGSTNLCFGGTIVNSQIAPLCASIPLAGGSRRVKFAENNQVQPLNRVYGNFNYFHNAIVSGGLGAEEQSKSVSQGAFGIEKTFFDDYLSFDLRMPFTGGVEQLSMNLPNTNAPFGSEIRVDSGGAGNLSTSIKAYLLQIEQTSISGGLSISLPTGSGVDVLVSATEFNLDGDLVPIATTRFEIDNDAVHLMPFLGVYRPLGDSWWLQAFTQIDTPANGNDVRQDGQFIGRLTEQTLLYSDISLGKWWYRKPPKNTACDSLCDSGCDSKCSGRGRGGCDLTGIASLFELHYTSSLNDADELLQVEPGGPGAENRFDVLNLTVGLLFEYDERWRINVAGAFPLREGRFDEFGSRQDDRFFDSEFSLQINRFF